MRLTTPSRLIVEFGPFDCIDNTGSYYQSADFSDALEKGRALVAKLNEEVPNAR